MGKRSLEESITERQNPHVHEELTGIADGSKRLNKLKDFEGRLLLDDAQGLWCRAETVDQLAAVEDKLRHALRCLEISAAQQIGSDSIKAAMLDAVEHIHLHAAVQRLGVLLLQRDKVIAIYRDIGGSFDTFR